MPRSDLHQTSRSTGGSLDSAVALESMLVRETNCVST